MKITSVGTWWRRLVNLWVIKISTKLAILPVLYCIYWSALQSIDAGIGAKTATLLLCFDHLNCESLHISIELLPLVHKFRVHGHSCYQLQASSWHGILYDRSVKVLVCSGFAQPLHDHCREINRYYELFVPVCRKKVRSEYLILEHNYYVNWTLSDVSVGELCTVVTGYSWKFHLNKIEGKE